MSDSLNFPLILVVATALFGLIWLIDAVLFAKARRERQAAAGNADTAEDPILVEYAKSFFPVLLVVLVLRSFFFEPFRIPSGSMIPTLLVGDFILVSKYSYGVRLPVVHTKILETGEPQRGDVAVFRYPLNPNQDYIKRVVGLPGDTIVYENKTLTVNGEKVEISGGEPYVIPDSADQVPELLRRTEVLGDVEHDILIAPTGSPPRREYKVPDGHYFMVGDNRDFSNDSRYWGFVPEENLVGKAKYIWMHWQNGIKWSRLGDKIE